MIMKWKSSIIFHNDTFKEKTKKCLALYSILFILYISGIDKEISTQSTVSSCLDDIRVT